MVVPKVLFPRGNWTLFFFQDVSLLIQETSSVPELIAATLPNNILAVFCGASHNLALNIKKTKELIIDFRRCKAEPLPLYINGDCVERVHSFKFLGTHISDNFTWSVHTMATAKKAQQHLHFLKLLKESGLVRGWNQKSTPLNVSCVD
uniref:Alkylated DNA repair protein AlkB homologue 8 N-terminal domain-containing protein n=1 Tax=Micrurus lemniscatus lemniscatus TaxID=129467 RepID=A0A2D4IYL1_MICLE